MFGFLRRYVTGILPRYVMGQVVKSFALALLTITAVFVLIMVMTEATRAGLTPREIAGLVPFIIPSTLPYTVPVAMLFSVSVVYGRLAADNEVIAVKTAGLSALTVLGPALAMGLSLSAAMLVLCQGPIPDANHRVKSFVFRNAEDYFYKFLKKDRQWDSPGWPFFISVRDVDIEKRVLIGPVFMHKAKEGGANAYDFIVSAEEAVMRFENGQGLAHVLLKNAECQGGAAQPDKFLIDGERLDIPLNKKQEAPPKRVQEQTSDELIENQAKMLTLIANERKRQAVAAGLWIASGRIGRVDWPHIQAAFRDYQFWKRQFDELETERQMRIAMACGSFFFVLLGGPVGIRFARGDFLSAFMSCFLPIILIYYPLTLLGINLGKEGKIPPVYALWSGNLVLGLLAGFVALPPVMKH